jgi:hypothetical protein
MGGVDFETRESPDGRAPVLTVAFGQPQERKTLPVSETITTVRLADGRIERMLHEEVRFDNPSQSGIRGLADRRTVFFRGDEVWQIDFGVEPIPHGSTQHIWLADGSRLSGGLTKWNRAGGTSVWTDLFRNIFLGRDTLIGVTCGNAPPPRLPRGVEGRDVLWMSNGDRLIGRMLRVEDGVFDFRSDLGTLSCPRHRIEAAVFAVDPSRERKQPRWVLTFANGDRVWTNTWQIHGDGQLECQVGGSRRKTRATLLRRALRLDSEVTVFSRIQPKRFQMRPALAGTHAIAVDGGADDRPLRVGGREYLFGLFLRPACEMDYALDEGARYFLADVGLSSQLAAEGRANVAFAVGDGPWKTLALDRKDEPTPLALALNGSRRLRIRVEAADDWAAGAHVVLGEPVVIRQK